VLLNTTNKSSYEGIHVEVHNKMKLTVHSYVMKFLLSIRPLFPSVISNVKAQAGDQ